MDYSTIVIGLIIIIVSILYYRQHYSLENFYVSSDSICPDYLAMNGEKYELWSRGKPIKSFDSYKDYMDYFNFTRANYTSKGISCKPLIPINRPVEANRDIVLDSRYVNQKLYNIELFEDLAKQSITQSTPVAQPVTPVQATQPTPLAQPVAPVQATQVSQPVAPVQATQPVPLAQQVTPVQATQPAPVAQKVATVQPTPVSPQISQEVSQKEKLIKEGQSVVLDYLEKNPECRKKIMAKDSEFYQQFENAFSNYMKLGFQKTIGYVPSSKEIAVMNNNEAITFIDLYRKMPECNLLIQKYSTLVVAPIKSKSIEKSPGDNLLTQEAPSEKKNLDIEKQKQYIQQQYSEKREKDQNRLFQYILNMDKNLQSLSSRVDNINNRDLPTKQTLNNSYSLVNANVVNALDKQSNKYIDAEREIASGISSSQNSMQVTQQPAVPIKKEDENKYLEQRMAENKKKAMATAPEYIKKGQQINSDFSYTPEYIPSGKQPSKEIYSAYGWSFMPPQSWSVPQRRPPVCIPQKGNSSTVVPIYDKSVPVDALEWTQVGSILPKFKYNEVYNSNYYEPGWISQDTPDYPFNPKHFKQEVYGNNFAQSTK